MSVCVSYSTTLRLIKEVSTFHSAPLEKWIKDGIIFKFWGDNVDKLQKVRDLRSDHKGSMIHMYSKLVARSRTQVLHLQQVGELSKLSEVPSEFFLPTCEDVIKVKKNLTVLVSRVLNQYITKLTPLSKAVTKHILHVHSKEMAEKSDVFVLDILMKNETKHKDMIDIRVIPCQINAKYRRPPQIFIILGIYIPFMKLLYRVDFEPHMLCGS